MDSSIITPVFTGRARFDDEDCSWWQIHVVEDFGDTTTRVASLSIPVKNGYTDEAWSYLADQGWRLTGREQLVSPHGVERSVQPPIDATVESLSGEEYVFVRRCRARGVSGVDAVTAWRSGDRDPDTVAARLSRENGLYKRVQASRRR